MTDDHNHHLPATWDGVGPGVAVCGDWHANIRFAEKALWSIAARGIRRIVHVGDFGYHFTPEFCTKMDTMLSEMGAHLWVTPGNHDDYDLIETMIPVTDDPLSPLIASEHMTVLQRGARWTWDGATWLGIGGAPSIDRAFRQDRDDRATKYYGWKRSWWEQERITDNDVNNSVRGGRADVVVSHDAPSEVHIALPVPQFPESDQVLCRESRKRLQTVREKVNPRLWLFGHYHQHGFREVNGTMYRLLDADSSSVEANVEVVKTAGGAPEFISLFDLPTVNL